MKFSIIYNKSINSFLRTCLKPFSKIIPDNLKFPVNGIFSVKGNNIKQFKVSTNPTSWFSKKVFWDNVEGFEFNSVKIFCEVVKNSSVFFDIGSNIGYYSLLASSIKNTNIVVYAFEPMPSAFNYLKENILINNFTNIKPQQLALSAEKGSTTFYSIVNPKFKDMPQLTGDGGLSQAQSGDRSKVNFEVQIDTLDNFVKENLGTLKIDLIKLDTEANEHHVLSGSHLVLSEHRPIIQCEILKNQIENEIDAILRKYDYLYYRATNQGLKQVESFLNNTTEYVDYYLVPKERKVLIEKFII
ncbi:FkbM family methyltransferase [Aurantibacillus circumpalustris]|uniref:FkbM family methyltransferase n=1 Tax=Aurantibacillus circumpalustris TaxID=3036359 RepID=UPI00295B4BA5|nr:FkbM family methyltransferase [Aurantibacillus circumpalustris]